MTESQQPGQGAQSQSSNNVTESNPSGASLPQQILQQAEAVASSAATDARQHIESETFPPLEDVPPPPYSAGQYGELDLRQDGFDTGARVAGDGRVDIKIDLVNRKLTHILTRQLTNQGPAEPFIPEGLGAAGDLPPPSLNIVIQVVGSRGDVQPFIALGQVLKNKFNHRVRLATHPVFRDFVTENGLEFFSIGGDPAELMAFMVKNPGLIPGVEALRSGDIGRKRKDIYAMINGCWRSSIEPGDGCGEPVSDALLDSRSSVDSAIPPDDPTEKPFVADAIIANPPSFAHIHIAEKLGIPLHLMFTMPWSPTQAYPHPLANILSSNTDQGMANFMSYVLVDLLTWQGVGDVINRFREKTLNLEPISILWAPGSLHRLRIPWTYAWSPALIPKPSDWSNFIDISGFFFLDLATNYKPPDDLAQFLDAGPPPVYIGFGSIVVDDPTAMTKLIFEAVKLSGQRALVSKGWGGLSAGELGQPDDVFILGNCPHDWLFKRVSAVVHHGGAGTTAAGVKAGKPTVVVPFFGDQPFWGNMVNRAGAGPKPIPYKELTAQNLAKAISEALAPAASQKAQQLSLKIQSEKGPEDGADSFHKFLGVSKLRCSIAPDRAAVWRVKRTDIRLSALAATVLANEQLIDFSDLKLYRPCEYEVDTGPPEPISGGAAAIIGSIAGVTAGVADFPSEVLRGTKSASNDAKKRQASSSALSTPEPASRQSSSTNLPSTSTQGQADSNVSTVSPDPSIVSPVPTDEEKNTPTASTPAASTTGVSDDQKLVLATAETGDSTADSRRERSLLRSISDHSHMRRSSDDVGKMTLGTAIGSAKATGNIVAAGLKSPMDFTMSLAKGFHNLPRLYNDTTVRPTQKVTGFNSGLKAAGKAFAYGFMDGVGGLVTQPMQGFQKEGAPGLVKGLVKGSFGLVFKPGAAIWGLPAYTMKGIYTEITNLFGKSTTNYIIAARMAQGYEEYQRSGEEDRERIIAAWHAPDYEDRYRRKRPAKQKMEAKASDVSKPGPSEDRLVDANGQLLSGFRNTMHLTLDERKELARRKKEQEQQAPSSYAQQVDTSKLSNASDAEFRDAIRVAVQRTSTNNAQQDEAIESAIWASVRELQRSNPDEKVRSTEGSGDATNTNGGEDAYRRAVAASVAEYKRSQRIGGDSKKKGQQSGVLSTNKDTFDEYDEDDELTRAITASLEEYTRGDGSISHSNYDNDQALESAEDEDLKRALAESLKPHQASQSSAGETIQASSSSTTTLQPTLPPRYTASREDAGAGAGAVIDSRHQDLDAHDNDADDAELQEALRQSEQAHAKWNTDLEKQKTEEDIVMEYIKKQSLAEEEYRRQHTSSSGGGGP